MAGEARKAAERARVWLNGRHQRNAVQNPAIHGVLSQEVEPDITHLLAEYEAATIEQCAQIADARLDEPDTGTEDACKQIAAAIRSIAQQDSANEEQ